MASIFKNKSAMSISDTVLWYYAIILVLLMLMSSIRDNSITSEPVRGGNLHRLTQPCEEIYVVGEGETLHTISDKCGDPFIVEKNPHIHDPDDVFPGLVIKITPISATSVEGM